MLPAVSNPVAPAPRRVGRYDGDRRTIFVVDDDADHQTLMREVLEPLGFSVVTARDGPTCLALVADLSPDLFLLDVSMPGMSGWDLARSLRATGHDRTPIIMLSANIGAGVPGGADSDENGPDAILPKPFDLDSLLDTLQRLLRLEWDAPLDPSKPTRAVVPDRPIAAPDREELLSLSRIGYVRGIKAKLDQLGADPARHAMVERLRSRIDVFDLDGLEAILDKTPHG